MSRTWTTQRAGPLLRFSEPSSSRHRRRRYGRVCSDHATQPTLVIVSNRREKRTQADSQRDDCSSRPALHQDDRSLGRALTPLAIHRSFSQVRVGVAQAYIDLFTRLGASWTQRNGTVVVRALLELLVVSKVSNSIHDLCLNSILGIVEPH